MRTKRSVESQSFLRTRTSGHLLAALALEAGGALDVPPTVEVKDYPAAAEAMVEMNKDVLQNEKSKELQAWDQWDQELGLVAFNANTPPDVDGTVVMQTRQVVQEFWSRFRDGVFHLAADRQFEEAGVKIAGGYLKPYENVLFYNEFDQGGPRDARRTKAQRQKQNMTCHKTRVGIGSRKS